MDSVHELFDIFVVHVLQYGSFQQRLGGKAEVVPGRGLGVAHDD